MCANNLINAYQQGVSNETKQLTKFEITFSTAYSSQMYLCLSAYINYLPNTRHGSNGFNNRCSKTCPEWMLIHSRK